MPTICVISDPHVAPGQDLTRFKQLAKFLNQYRPQYLICLGDWTSLDSMSAHEQVGGLKHKRLPSLKADIQASNAAHQALFGALKYKPVTVMIKGNHEDRFDRWKDRNPQLEDLMGFDETFNLQEYWTGVYEYREYFDLEGIRFTHVPHTGMGRAVSGTGKSRRVALQSSKPCVFGHGHDLAVSTTGEITGGPATKMGISCPAFMNDGNVEKYAKGNHTGWTYGFLMIRPQGKDRVPSFDYVSMRDLKALS